MSTTLANSKLAPLLTHPETAEYLRIEEQTLRKWRLHGSGPPFVRVGKRIRYRQADLEAWLQENVCRSTSEART